LLFIGRENMSKKIAKYCMPVAAFFSIITLVFMCDSSSDDITKGEIVKGEIGKKLDTYLTRITPFGFSGTLLVAKGGEIVLNKGYGMAIRSENVHNTSDTVFSTGSITKQFTAAGIMKLEMMGKLRTSDLLSKYFDNVPEDKKDITLHHLLTHTSGVVDWVGNDYEKAQRDETVRKVLNEPLEFMPGEQFSYSNMGYSVLAAIIEKVSGRAYEEFVHVHIFKPAGMAFTGYRIPEWTNKVVAHWYVGDKDNRTPLEKPYPYWKLLGNGGILSTTMDMYRWHLALLGVEVLSNEAKKKIFTPFLNNYGYGWDVLDTKRGTLIQHDGASMLGNSAEMRRYIDAGVVTILFCNQSYWRGALFEPIRDKVEELAFGGEVTLPPAVTTANPEKLKTYEGTYTLSGGGTVKVTCKGGQLLVQPKGQDAVNAIFMVNMSDAEMLEQLNRISEKIFISALSGDFEEFGKVLYDRNRWIEPARDHIQMRLARHKKQTGGIKEVKAKVALPTGFGGERSAQTIVELQGERESLYFSLDWHDSKIVGIDPTMGVPSLSIPFLPLTGTDFAGYLLDMGRNFRINFLVDADDRVTGLVVPNEDDPLKATR
jgi:CubicO group peptidase (beta-lactamase class C family)